MKRLITLVFVIYIGFSFMGCTKETISQIPIEKTLLQDSNIVNDKIENTEEFIKSLNKFQFKIKTAKEDNHRFLSGALTKVSIGEDTIGVYEYKNNQQMENDSRTISSDGSMVGNGTIYEWNSKPHFYKSGNVIVLYIGINTEITKKIEQVMGMQFAGMM